jgi:hypothetical protein
MDLIAFDEGDVDVNRNEGKLVEQMENDENPQDFGVSMLYRDRYEKTARGEEERNENT